MFVEHTDDRNLVIVVNVLGTKKSLFTIIEEKEIDSLKLIKGYTSLRPQGYSLKILF